MTRYAILRAALPMLAAAVLGAPRAAAEPPDVCRWSLDGPQPEFAADLKVLAGNDERLRKDAAKALAKQPDAEPYLRHYCSTRAGRYDDLAAGTLAALMEARGERLAARAAEWAKQGRYDLVIDAALQFSSDERADATAQLLFAFAETIRPAVKKLGGPQTYLRLGTSMKAYKEDVLRDYKRPLLRFHELYGLVEVEAMSPPFVRARSCETAQTLRYRWLVLTRDELKGVSKRGNQWEDCYIFHNGDLALDDCMMSLVVCDGDVTFVRGGCDGTVVIAGGSIKGEIEFGVSTLSARGDIVAPKAAGTSSGLVLAGGKIDLAPVDKKVGLQRMEKAGVADDPFGMRFFQTADVGVVAVWKGGALTVAKLTAGSPLARHDVQVGDVVTRVNDREVKSAQDFRRELRFSVVAGAGVFHFRREGQDRTRIVYFRNGLEK
jgi:hypothetical protein